MNDTCLKCDGWCCKGHFAFGVSLTDEEVDFVEGLRPGCTSSNGVSKNNILYFKSHKCPFQDAAGFCEIYDSRPIKCREYKCATLQYEDVRDEVKKN